MPDVGGGGPCQGPKIVDPPRRDIEAGDTGEPADPGNAHRPIVVVNGVGPGERSEGAIPTGRVGMLGDHDPHLRTQGRLRLCQGLRVGLDATPGRRVILPQVNDLHGIDPGYGFASVGCAECAPNPGFPVISVITTTTLVTVAVRTESRQFTPGRSSMNNR